jgi:hypothetical protein
MIPKVCKLSGMRSVGLNMFEQRGVSARSDSADLAAPITTGEAVVASGGGS